MRLIDADALDYALGASDEDIYFHHMLEDAPTIDAIPVEWMDAQIRGYASALKSTETAALVRVMQMWQKEQEAR